MGHSVPAVAPDSPPPPGLRAARAWIAAAEAQLVRPLPSERVTEIVRWCHDDGPCHDCGAAIGADHDEGCDVVRCSETGTQRLSTHALGFAGEHECAPGPWTGMWPGVEECIEFGWYSRFEGGWHRCGPADEGAGPDLNRLTLDAQWDRGRQKWAQR